MIGDQASMHCLSQKLMSKCGMKKAFRVATGASARLKTSSNVLGPKTFLQFG